MKIHLDTDLGGDPDDLCALALLLNWPGVELTGITTCGEVAGRRAGYVRYALELIGRPDIPVASGAEAGVNGLRFPNVLPNEADYWPEPVVPDRSRAGEALELLDASLNAGATVIGIGPYTNLALYEEGRPGKLAQNPLVLMGGYIGPMKAGLPQWKPDCDWNMHQDVAATLRVLGCTRPLLVPVNATVLVHLRARDLPRLRAAGPLTALIARQAEAVDREYDNQKLGRAHALLPDDLLNFHHDPLACAVALGWSGVRIEDMRLRVELQNGYPVERPDPSGDRYRVVTDVDGEAFERLWLNTVAPVAAG